MLLFFPVSVTFYLTSYYINSPNHASVDNTWCTVWGWRWSNLSARCRQLAHSLLWRRLLRDLLWTQAGWTARELHMGRQGWYHVCREHSTPFVIVSSICLYAALACTYGHIQAHAGTCGHIWAHVGTCRHMRAHAGTYGHIRAEPFIRYQLEKPVLWLEMRLSSESEL